MNPYIHIGTFTFESYTMMTNLGTVCGFFAAYLVLEKYCSSEKRYWKLIPFLFLIMVIGDPWARLVKGVFGGDISNGATHFLPRVFLAVIILPFFMQAVWKQEGNKEQAYNAAALYFVVQHFFNRIACWMNGCCGGIDFNTQLLEAGMMAVMTLLLLICIQKKISLYRWICTGFAVIIFISEYLIDQPEVGRVLGMTSVQVTAILMVLWVNACQKKKFKV